MNLHIDRRHLLAFVGLALLSAPIARAGEVQPLMGQPVDGLTPAQLDRFVKGSTAFSKIFQNATGLGPAFNDQSCVNCHAQPDPGGFSDRAVTRFGKQASGGNPFDPLASLGGTLLQKDAISPTCQEFVPPQADVTAKRVTPQTFGAGLAQAVDDADILQLQNSPPSPNVSGIARIVQPLEGGPLRVAKFGWKAGVATMLSFSGDASLNEMGITNRLVGTENAPNGDLAKLAMCDTVADPEDGPDAQGFDAIDRMDDFQRFLAPPPQMPKSGMTGEAWFVNVGCADCHIDTPYVTTAQSETALSGKSIKPYTDFLLHDMGSLGDGIVDGIATEREMKTSALWGVSSRAAVGLLHDGRATGGTAEQNLVSAIQSHDGEAAASRTAYNTLATNNPAAAAQLLAFLMSLGRAEFDMQGDNDRDEFDYFFWFGGMTGPVGAVTPDDAAAVGDSDGDGDLDMADFGRFQRSFTGAIH